MAITIGTETALTLSWSDINNTVVANPNNVNDWNTFFQLPTYGTPFNSVRVNGNTVTLIGGKNIELPAYLFTNNIYITSIIDNGCITFIGDFCFTDCTSLTTVYLSSVIRIEESVFQNCLSLAIISMPVIENLGPTTGDDGIFNSINNFNPITLTVPLALSTVNGGFPDGDIFNLPAGSTVNYGATGMNWVNVLTYGATRDGVTNDTAAIQAAINDAARTNRTVFIPNGNYLVDTLELSNNITIVGNGIGNTELIYRGPQVNVFDALMVATSNSTETEVENITLENLTFYGQVDVNGFSEFKHLLYLVGVDGVTINNCEFKGFRGDGICLGGINLYDSTPRHNYNVTIRNCVFDGIDKNNRNAISIIDVTNLLVEECEFKNCTKSNMPGAIDFEPDHDYNIVLNCTVNNNTFTNIGGNGGVIGINLNDIAYEQFPSTFLIQNNTMTNCTNVDGTLLYAYKRLTTPVDVDEGMSNVIWRNNTITNCIRPFLINSANGLQMENCTFTNISNPAYVSYYDVSSFPFPLSRNVSIVECVFDRCSNAATYGILITDVNNLLFYQNQFIDCGNSTVNSSAIYFYDGESYSVNFTNNVFSSPTGKTLIAIKKSPTHTFNPATNTFVNNTLNGLINEFQYS